MTPPTAENKLIERIREIVSAHYERDSSPMLLADLGLNLRKSDLWKADKANGRTLRQFIEAAHDPDLVILRDPNSPAYVAVATAAHKQGVETWIARRSQAASMVPNLEALPRSVLLAFCVKRDVGKSIFLNRYPPFKYEIGTRDGVNLEQYIEIADRYRRPGLNLLSELTASDRLDLQTKIAMWSKDTNIPIEAFYVHNSKRAQTALDRLIAAQSEGIAEKMVIPGDIALMLSRQQ